MSVILSRFFPFFCLCSFFAICSCSKPLKEPPGKLYGTVTLDPDPGPGENWAYLNATSEIAAYETMSDPQTHQFAFENLKVKDLYTSYYLLAERPGYISYADSILIEAGIAISNFNIVLRHGLRQDTSFQDGVYPDPSYFGCMDTYISYPDSTETFGGSPVLLASGSAPDTVNRVLIRFSFGWQSYFPAPDSMPAEIEKATLSIYIDSVFTSGSVSLAVFNLEHIFDENSASWSANGFNPWPGGPGGTWGQVSSDTVSVEGLTTGWVHFDIARIAANWLAARSPGPMMIKLIDESRPSSVYMRSSEHPSAGHHPELNIAVVYPQ